MSHISKGMEASKNRYEGEKNCVNWFMSARFFNLAWRTSALPYTQVTENGM